MKTKIKPGRYYYTIFEDKSLDYYNEYWFQCKKIISKNEILINGPFFYSNFDRIQFDKRRSYFTSSAIETIKEITKEEFQMIQAVAIL